MALKTFKPTSAGRRHQTNSFFEEITTSQPEKSLVRGLTKKGGRNNDGRITARHRGGGHKRRYRFIDFKRDKIDIPAKVASIEYDPNWSARIALLHYADGDKRYILAPNHLKVGDSVISGETADIQPFGTFGSSFPTISQSNVVGQSINAVEFSQNTVFSAFSNPAVDTGLGFAGFGDFTGFGLI